VCHGAIDIFIAPNIHLSSRSESSSLNTQKNKTKINTPLSTPENSISSSFKMGRECPYFFPPLLFSVITDIIFLTCHRGDMCGAANGASG
jgi:hypothetical protein